MLTSPLARGLFAKTGVPAQESGPAWPSFTPDGDRLIEFSNNGAVVVRDFGRAHLDALETATPLR
ncbi:hypothetical protein [Brevundimonas sp.]|uniref:hypothetical protein n=1 Tax=Brevundimonas sp. TaxID=1871086 RepID=UPI0037BF9513